MISMLAANSSFAALTIAGVTGVSSASDDFKTLYGGKAGTCASPVSSQTCNTCSGALSVCNEKSIHTSLDVTFTMSTDSSDAAGANRYFVIANSANTVVKSISLGTVSVNSNFTATINWSEICSWLGTAGCAASATGSFTIGLSTDGTTLIEAGKAAVSIRLSVASGSELRVTDNCKTTTAAGEGVCYISLDRGDQKAYITDFVLSTDYPAVGSNTGDEFVAVRFYSESDSVGAVDTAILGSVTLASPYKRLTLIGSSSSGYSLDDDRITGLANEVRECIVFANETRAGNIIRFTKDSGTDWTPSSPFCVTPSKVVGLLDDKKCFIATAAFGSPLEKEVQVLRDFRDAYLKTNILGSQFVKYYYHYSPPVAQWISEHETVRAVVRVLLWPLVLFARILLEYGFFIALLFIVVIGCSVFGLVKSLRKEGCEHV